jgi:hypothetical protein
MSDLANATSGLVETTDGLLKTMNPVMQKIADTFCVSVDYVRDNLGHFVMEYGKYTMTVHVVHSVTTAFCWSLVIAIMGIVCVLGGAYYYDGEHYELVQGKTDGESYKKCVKNGEWKKWIKLCVWSGLMLVLIPTAVVFCYNFVPYAISPEIYSLNAVVDLAKGLL